MRYDIKAIPTVYSGVTFRSRLEARWAAFFDLIGWKWEYEPFDLNGWAPDFRVVTAKGSPILIEVKPVSSGASSEFVSKAFAKCADHYEHPDTAILLLGFELNDTHMGWKFVARSDGTYGAKPFLKIGLKHDVLWRKAGNAVQWKKRKR